MKRKLVKHRERSEETYRHILVAVAGQTPQIITETLYALMVARRPPVPISEVYIVTTARGGAVARRALLDREQGQFFAFCREYGIDPQAVAFDENHIITVKQPVEGNRPPAELEDIRTVADNAALAQQLLGFIKQLTADPETALHCSIAGGRKTMSAYLALALTLYGRQQDTLSHVLVSEEFESNPKFFFPSRPSRMIAVRRGGEWDVAQTEDARIELAEIPFVRLRERLGEWFAALDQAVEGVIHTAQYELDLRRPAAERLVIDVERRQVSFGDTEIPLRGVHLGLYIYFAETKTQHCVRPDLSSCAGCIDCYQSLQELDQDRLIEAYRDVSPHSPATFEERLHKKRGKSAMVDQDNLQSYLSRANHIIGQAEVSQQLKIISTGSYGDTRYGLGIDKTRIEVRRTRSA